MTPFHVFRWITNYKSFSIWRVSGFLRSTIKSNYSKMGTIFPYSTGLFISLWNVLQIHNKWTTHWLMVVLTLIERETLQVFLHISQMLNVSTFGNTADIYVIVHLIPHTCQHIMVDQSHSSGDSVAKIWRLAGSEGTKTASFTNLQKKRSHGVKSRDRCGHCINASSACPVHPIHLVASFDWDTLACLCSELESHLVKRCNHYCLHSIVASVSFLICFTDLWITVYNWNSQARSHTFLDLPTQHPQNLKF